MTELPALRITQNLDVFIGGDKLPGVIAEDGIRISPGGRASFNTVSITFIVGSVDVEDPTI